MVDALRAISGSGFVRRVSLKYGLEAPYLTSKVVFRIQIDEDEVDGGYIAECLDLPGCLSQGDTPEEALDNIVDAISGVLETRLDRHIREAQAEAKSSGADFRHRALDISVT